ncbi:PEP-CTERM-box response regulator transcription factor [Sediminicurvatus halobius]|uniref:PEP-CTERM-box response regulator transcription factor n=1 Tax=Sediminicurvatus halobius TaxID=2182432 RepID=UPI001E41F73C|nr:PEP-CTERM-box response regulator transcription factor [Spiribacter halobius]UEX77363.1 PEP-CTERM-box response regulator transcription factor [Spiribacter halobius]
MPRANPALLIVEDDSGLQQQLKWCFSDDYQVLLAENRERGLELVDLHEPPIVLLDLGLPPDAANASEGLRALEQILVRAPETKVIVITGNEAREHALEAVGTGAYDYYQKPVDPDLLQLIVERAYRLHELQMERRRLVQSPENPLEGVIATSPQMLRACRLVERVASSDATVLLLGESGTGKELLAQAVHRLSGRKNRRMVAINCASIPENLLESELFGFEKGAFTGATRQTIGKIEYADGGTLFLDEIGDLPLSLQAKLLRFLQERVIERLGARGEIPVDVRVVCATNQDLHAMMRAGDFREDLYYRLSEISVEVPSLRDRDGDAALLAHAFLRRYAERDKRPLRGFSADALAAIRGYSWPGNVRELENVIRRAVIMADGAEVTAADLGLDVDMEEVEPLKLREVRDRAERRTVSRALGLANGNLVRASELLGVSRPTLYSLLNKYGLRNARWGEPDSPVEARQ